MLSPVTKFDLRDREKPGWKDEDGKTFEELLDWGKLPDPQKGFGELGRISPIKERKLTEDAERIVLGYKPYDTEGIIIIDKKNALHSMWF